MIVSLVVPLYNEQDTLQVFYDAVRASPELAPYAIELLLVDDGSTDRTQAIAAELARTDPLVTVVCFSRNFGKEAALFAGLDHASGDAVIPIDVDLQDPIDVIPRLIERWQAGADVVLAKRADRTSDSYLKRRSAHLFYRLHNRLADREIEEDVGDFRLMSRQVVESVRQLPERQLFMKGLLSWVGFDTAIVEYVRAPRVAGTTKFNGWKLWNLALEGITSFSTMPLRIWTYLGFTVAVFAFLYGGWMVIDKLVWGNLVPGYPSLMTAIMFLGGVQLIGIGVLGEYIGRIYIESKERPRYIVKRVLSQHAERRQARPDRA
ncbi:MAG: glycosyltransferase [Comamonadaceae bacterium]|nr:MAG: glycosyltransferase [Comamonadaceae bacterium]